MKMVDDQLSVASEDLEQTLTLKRLRPSSFGNQNTKSREGSMLVVREFQDRNENLVFPPINHENLHISSNSHQFEYITESPSSSSSSSSVSSFSPSETDTWVLPSPTPSDSLVRKNGHFAGWMGIGLEVLCSKAVAVVTSFRNYSINKAAIRSIGPAASVVLLSWWIYIQVWRWLRRRRRQTREKHLMTIINQKDERIAQLLHQIAQMNEILIARHRALASKLAN
ncbi:hypothetical protein L6164_011202 [Bauhinia variegata]|uniref:Uncharacterized protein n=1 Tax=Bauhinia variegata TaxID=167791 RepID=A0ACB9P7B3_BAUVA|nr:hypothetical protein L6164_011202 [Bauhinia variegata]